MSKADQTEEQNGSCRKGIRYCCRIILLLLYLSAPSYIAAESKSDTPVKSPPLLSTAIDFSDACWVTKDDHYTLEDLRKNMRMAREAGLKKVYFRIVAGVSYHPSKLKRMYAGDADRPNSHKVVRTIKTYDPLAEYLKVAEELDVEVHYWVPIFDTQSYLRYAPWTEEAGTYGEFPYRDRKIENEHLWKHRFAASHGQKLKMPIGQIDLILYRPPQNAGINSKNLVILTAGDKQPFKRYDGNFTVSSSPRGKGTVVSIKGLSIDKPCIKLANDVERGKFMALADLMTKCVELKYVDGSPVDLFSSWEVTKRLTGDDDWVNNDRGASGLLGYWGGAGHGKDRTFIIRAGLFDKYLGGVPEYAFRATRDRRLSLAKELFENYPDLGGLCYSVRSHSLPSGGGGKELGWPVYGFSKPIVDAYKRKYGIDITKEDFDRDKFWSIRGDFFTEFLREVGDLVHSKGKEFEVLVPVSKKVPHHHGVTSPVWKGAGIDNFFQIDRWAKEGVVDMVLMLGIPLVHRSMTPNWENAWKDEIDRFKQRLKGTKCKLGLHFWSSGWRPAELEKCLPVFLRNPQLDEIEFYEQEFLERHYPVIKKSLAGANPNGR